MQRAEVNLGRQKNHSKCKMRIETWHSILKLSSSIVWLPLIGRQVGTSYKLAVSSSVRGASFWDRSCASPIRRSVRRRVRLQFEPSSTDPIGQLQRVTSLPTLPSHQVYVDFTTAILRRSVLYSAIHSAFYAKRKSVCSERICRNQTLARHGELVLH